MPKRRSDLTPLLGTTGATAWLPGGAPGDGRIARTALTTRADIRSVDTIAPQDLVPRRTIYECILAAATLDPDKPAIKHLVAADPDVPPRVLSYGKFVGLLRLAANLFHTASAGQRPAVAVILPMLPEALIATWGATTVGIAAPINPFLEVDHIAGIMNAAQATVLVTAAPRHGDGAWNKLSNIRDLVPTLRQIYIVDGDDPETDFLSALQQQPADRLLAELPSDGSAEAIYLPTGGTTAAPKLVRMTHRAQLINAWNIGALMGASADDVVGHALPLFHVGGLVTIALRAMIYGQTLVTLTTAGFRNPEVIKNFWRLADHFGLTTIVATPTTAAALVANADAPPPDHRLKSFHCGGSTIPLEIVRAFHERFGVWLREAWGMSEVCGVVTGQPDDGEPPVAGSVGYILPHHAVKVVKLDEDTNTFIADCAPGERGVLLISGAALTPGYVEPELDAAFFVNGMPDGRIWANTGDIGLIDERQYLWLFGRAKDVIIRGGHNIDPMLIEEVLAHHPAVELAGAVGRPDAAKGEMPVAYVQLRKGAAASPEELMAFCRDRIQERAAAPVEIVIWEQLPVTLVGKLFKPALRVDAMRRVATQTASDVVGDRGDVAVSVDESGRRPCAIVKVDQHAGEPSELRQRLEAAFGSFGFATTIDIAGR